MRQHLQEDDAACEAARVDQELFMGSLVWRRESATTVKSYCGPARGILTLCFATEAVRDDHEIVLRAVQQNPHALRFASQALRGDQQIVCAAVRIDPTMLRFAAEEMRYDCRVALAAVSSDGCALHFFAAEVRRDRA